MNSSMVEVDGNRVRRKKEAIHELVRCIHSQHNTTNQNHFDNVEFL